MADAKRKHLPVATALPKRGDPAQAGGSEGTPDRGMVIDPLVLVTGGLVALLGVGILAAFLWMVPNAAAREAHSACRGIGGYNILDGAPNHASPMLCPGGQPCQLPIAAPDFTATDHTGKPVKLSDFRGKVVLLNFWASWCGVCKTEKPALTEMAESLGSDDFVVITLASDRDWSEVLVAVIQALAPGAPLPARAADGTVAMPAALEAYQRALPNGIPFKVFLDPPQGDATIGQITASWGIKAVPESALIDRDGNIRAYFVNKRDWEAPVARTCLRAVIDE